MNNREITALDYLALSLIGVKGKGTVINDIELLEHGKCFSDEDTFLVHIDGKESEKICFQVWGESPKKIRYNFKMALFDKFGRTIENTDDAKKMLSEELSSKEWCPFNKVQLFCNIDDGSFIHFWLKSNNKM